MVGYATPTTADLNHKIALCSANDIIDTNGVITVSRTDVAKCWAKIETITSSMYSKSGHTIREERDKRSHRITIRGRTGTLITSAAWIFEERLQSQPIWYKVLAVGDLFNDGRFTFLDVRIYEISDAASRPVSPDTGLFSPSVNPNVNL